ncbi:MAG: polysaccharide biosynthesis tyrosine autokinase [Chloroflexi bacterium]|nr:polysaccharide biosynthesis tyrosine autokinase [Chloroflexota bacterium]
MEIKDYLSMARRWAWLLIIGLVLGAAGGFVGSIFQTPVYQASTQILVLRASQTDQNTDTYLSDQQLVQTYIQLLTTRPVLDGASALLGYGVNKSQVTVSQIGTMQAIKLTVEDGDPQRAADIANILVQVLIAQNEQIQTGRYALTEQSIQSQITQVQAQISQMGTELQNVSAETVQQQLTQVEGQIATMQAEVTQLQNDIFALTPPTTTEQQSQLSEKQARLNQIQPVLMLSQQIYTDLVVLGKPSESQDGATRLSQLQTTMQLYQEIYINLLNNLEAVRLARLQNTPNVVSIEAAVVPTKPIRPKPITNTGLAAAVGLILAGGIVFLIEYLDDTIRTPDDVERILKLPIIGYIGNITVSKSETVDMHVLKHPRSPIAEAFRSLRTNLEYANVDHPLSKILVASSGPGEGKSTIASNLAVIIAQGGKRVLLIDADMRRPRIHAIFGIPNHVGLSALFRGSMTLRSAMRPAPGLENVFIITSGNLPPNPTELLASARMDQILQEASREVDVVVVDSPPSLVADYQVLSTKMDGVIMVIQPGSTHADTASAMLDQLGRVNAAVFGIVLNKIPRNNYHYGGYHYYSAYSKRGGYYEQTGQPAQPQPKAEDPIIKALPQAGPYQPYAASSMTQMDPFPVELLEPLEDEEPIRIAPKVDQQPDDLVKARREMLEELFNSKSIHEPVRPTVPPPAPIPATQEIPTKPRHMTEDVLPALSPKYTVEKYDLEYTFTDTDFGKEDR